MSRVFSFRDLLRIPALSEYNEIQLLHPEMDMTVNIFLRQLGFDLNHAILYVPAQHRDLSGKVAIGFRAVGEISDNREFLTSRLCTITERLVAAARKDPSLCRELCQMMGNSINLSDGDSPGDGETYPDELVEETFDSVATEIRNLENIRDTIRGTPYDEAGALKLPGAY